MEKVFKFFFFVVIAVNLVLSSWFVLHHDIQFTSEVARDFLLLEELDQKKIVLIGPSSTTGLFHGPLWTYINYPAFVLGHGDPVFVGWNWIFLIVLFLLSGFFIAKKLFDTKTAYFFTLMISIYCVFHAKALYNPHGAMFVLPAFFFFFVRYIQTLKLKYLAANIFLAGALIHLQMALGIPFFILSFLYGSFVAIKKKRVKHIAMYALILVPLANFIIFNLRHDFLLTKLIFHFLASGTRDNPSILSMLDQRVELLSNGVEIIRRDPGNRNLVNFFILAVFLVLQIKNNKYKKIYLTFLYFYLGFFILSLGNAGGLLYFYFFPIFPLVFLIFSSFVTCRYSKFFIVVFFVIFTLNMQNGVSDMKAATESFGKDKESWLFLKNASSLVFKGEEQEFGYFVYSPDVIAYRSKYALTYQEKLSSKKAYYFQKKPITYLFITPPISTDPYKKDEWWRVNLLHIDREPDSTVNFPNGYKIEKYLLSPQEISVPVEPNIDPGLIFR